MEPCFGQPARTGARRSPVMPRALESSIRQAARIGMKTKDTRQPAPGRSGAERAYWDGLIKQSEKDSKESKRVLERMQRDSLKRSK
ncbi:hypothetical protein [Burkholderia sp. MSMB1588]|uniref:hypothetical protein n=1 Tax=Burkholderia sp. MSMB1588 TaxID=1636423 RepID=UPI00114641D4|nr:hypothetical protein [Burkholderia sp. MSMB1588]